MVRKKKPSETGGFGLDHGEGDAIPEYQLLLKAYALKKVLEEIDTNTPFISLSAHVEAIEKTENNTTRMMLRVSLFVKDPETFSEFFEIFHRRNRDLVGLVVS